MRITSEKTSWDPQWEQVFQSREWGKYRPEELIRFIARNYHDVAARRKAKLTEVGCGTGSNVWFMAREGFTVFGLDGSPTAISKISQRLKTDGLDAQLTVADIAAIGQQFSGPAQFDAVIDVCCLQCNRFAQVRAI